MEAHSGYSGNYFGIVLSDLGTYSAGELSGHKFHDLMADATGTKGRWMGFGVCVNISDWSNPRLGVGAKYNYEDSSATYGYRHVMENISPPEPVYMGVEYGVFGKFRFMTQETYGALGSYDEDTIYFVRDS